MAATAAGATARPVVYVARKATTARSNAVIGSGTCAAAQPVGQLPVSVAPRAVATAAATAAAALVGRNEWAPRIEHARWAHRRSSGAWCRWLHAAHATRSDGRRAAQGRARGCKGQWHRRWGGRWGGRRRRGSQQSSKGRKGLHRSELPELRHPRRGAILPGGRVVPERLGDARGVVELDGREVVVARDRREGVEHGAKADFGPLKCTDRLLHRNPRDQ